MFQIFLRSRSKSYLRGILGEREFKARSAERDAETDQGRIAAVLRALDDAITNAETEQAGLTRRVDDVLLRASITAGNGGDEYLTREKRDSDHLDRFDNEIANGQRRLAELVVSISHYNFLKTALLSRFPGHKPAAVPN